MNLYLGGTEPGLVAYWKADEGSGQSFADFSGHGHAGILTNGSWRFGVELSPAITDQDEDGILDAQDNCPRVSNPDQATAMETISETSATIARR